MKTTHAELVFQTLRYVCETLADGDIQAVLDLGLRMDQIARLARFSLNDLRHLSDVPTHFMDVSVNAECLDRVIAHMERSREREALHDELIRNGAPYPMLFSFTGMTNREFAARRRLLGMSGSGRGRPPTPSEDDEQRVWAAWQASAQKPLEARYLHVSETTGVPLNLVWSMTDSWTFAGANRPSPDDKVILFTRSQPAADRKKLPNPEDQTVAGQRDQT